MRPLSTDFPVGTWVKITGGRPWFIGRQGVVGVCEDPALGEYATQAGAPIVVDIAPDGDDLTWKRDVHYGPEQLQVIARPEAEAKTEATPRPNAGELADDLRSEAARMVEQARATRASYNAAELRRRAALMVRAAEALEATP